MVRTPIEPEHLLMPLLTDRLNFGNIYFRDKTYTPDTVSQNIDAVAECLNKLITSNSPFVYLFAPNHIKMVYALYGIIKSGRICVLVDPAIGKLELAEMMADTVPGALIRIDKTTDTFDFEKEFEFKDCILEEKRLEGLEDVCLIVYTNASDGWAKGAMLTNESMLANANAIIESNNVHKGTVSCAIIALHHLFALQTGLIAPSLVQGDVLIEDTLDFKALRKIGHHLIDRRVSQIYAVPIVYYFLKKLPNIKDVLCSVKSLVSGGAKLNKGLYDAYKTDLGVEIHEGYGLTEASPICTWHRPEDIVKIDSVGRSFPCCEIKILNEENRELPAGKAGEICIKGSNVFKGYYNNEAATRETLRDDLLHTGDLGYTDKEGYLHITGLKKNILNLSGNKVYPAELERLMKMHENVLNVQVIGEPDELIGVSIIAKVQLKNKNPETEKEYRAWCEENIEKFKTPKNVEFSA